MLINTTANANLITALSGDLDKTISSLNTAGYEFVTMFSNLSSIDKSDKTYLIYLILSNVISYLDKLH